MIRKKKNGEPYKTTVAAKSGATYLLKHEGLESTVVELDDGFGLEDGREQEASVPEGGRPKRVPIGRRDVLTAPKRQGYVRRFVNIDEKRAGWGRVQAFLDAGYKPVTGDIPIGDERIAQASKMGSATIHPVGDDVKAILMEIKQEWYDEDQDEKLAKTRAITDSLKQSQPTPGADGVYGEVTID